MTLTAGLVVAGTIVVTQLMTSMVERYKTAKSLHFLTEWLGKQGF